METSRTLYRDSGCRWLLNPDPLDPDVSAFHPDDFLDGKTTLHVFSSQAAAEDFVEDLEEECNGLERNVTWSDPERFGESQEWGLVVEEHDESHPENLRGVIEIVHPN